MFQKCPICEGSGQTYSALCTAPIQCRTCMGTGIIDEVTGLPPYSAGSATVQFENIVFGPPPCDPIPVADFSLYKPPANFKVIS